MARKNTGFTVTCTAVLYYSAYRALPITTTIPYVSCNYFLLKSYVHGYFVLKIFLLKQCTQKFRQFGVTPSDGGFTELSRLRTLLPVNFRAREHNPNPNPNLGTEELSCLGAKVPASLMMVSPSVVHIPL